MNFWKGFLVGIVALTSFSGEAQDRVLNGETAEQGDYPWMCSIVVGSGLKGCSAVLVHPNWVLTAGHCDPGLDGSGYPLIDKVAVNSILSYPPYSSGSEVHEVSYLLLHEDYSFSTNEGPDLALIRLETASNITPIALATPAEASLYAPGSSLGVLGWGMTESSLDTDTLMVGNCSVIDYDTCNYLSDYYNLNEGGNICAGYFEGETVGGGAMGDSGGPLFVNSEEPLLVGIVSGGDTTLTTANSPGIYTLIPEYIDWINSTIAEDAASIQETVNQELVVRQVGEKRIELRLSSESMNGYEIHLFSASGEVLMSDQVFSSTIELDCRDFSDGLYFVHLSRTDSFEAFQTKFVVGDF